ncbi:MAG: hypothetical protein O7C75_11140, partial [Verrucomicrobia bacterium]|nr:hypothetical protein [Verrucomicrobiota bacterium]
DVPLLRPAWSWPPLHRLLQDNEVAKIIKTRFSEGRALLEEYLEQMGFFAPGTAAIVDLGWNGQIQDNLHQAFGHRQDFPRAEGFYFGLTANGMARQTLVSTLTPLVANQTRFVWNANAAFLCVQILEALTRAPHGTVINYSREEQGTIPVFKAEDTDPRQSEKKSDRLIAAIQFGVLSYAQAYVRAQRVLGFSAKHSLPYACTVLNRFMRGVKHAEAACLLQVGIALDLGSEAVTVHKTGPLGTYNPIKWLWRLFRLVSGSMWPHATLALKGGRILKTLYTVQQVLFEARTRRAFAGSKVDLRPDPSLAHSPCAEVALEEWCEYHDRRMDEQFRATLKQLNQNSEYGRIRAKLTIRDIIFLEWTRICTVLTCHILKMDRPENDGIPLGPYLWWRLARWLRGIL